jgi:hypothetical protein
LAGQEGSQIICPKCTREVPATLYCIRCGARLPTEALLRILALKSPLVQKFSTEKKTEEILELMSEISLKFTRKIDLLRMLELQEVSDKVFLKLYSEYTRELHEALETRTRLMNQLKSNLDKTKRSYDETNMLLEEIDVRNRIGEITLEELSDKTSNLGFKAGKLEDALGEIKTDLEILENIFTEKTPRELFVIETNIRTTYKKLEQKLFTKLVSQKTIESLRPDIESMLALLVPMLGDRKEKQRILQNALETIEARYRVGELSIEKYEIERQRIQSAIESIWT